MSSDLAGIRISTSDAELAQALVEQGGTAVRHATMMIARPAASGSGPRTDAGPDRREAHAGPDRVLPLPRASTDLDALAGELAVVRLAAHPHGHPDHDPTDDAAATKRRLRSLLAGEVIGPIDHELSGLVRGSLEQVHGAIVVTRTDADAVWSGGPWIADLFVDPQHGRRGIGRRLLGHAIDGGVARGEARIGLAVTVSNPAVGLYRAFGFTAASTAWTVELRRASSDVGPGGPGH